MRYQRHGESKLVSLNGVGESKVVALRPSVNRNWFLRQARILERVVVSGSGSFCTSVSLKWFLVN